MLKVLIGDLMMQRRLLISILLYPLFVIIVLSNSSGVNAFVMSIFFTVYIFIANLFTRIEKDKSDVMLNSLPIKRWEIVGARYLFAGLAGLLGVAAYLIVFTILSLLPFPIPLGNALITPEMVIAVFILVGFVVSVYYPLVIRFGFSSLRIFQIIFFISLFFFPVMISELIIEQPDALSSIFFQNMKNLILLHGGIFSFAFLLILLGTSFYLSVRIYRKKDF